MILYHVELPPREADAEDGTRYVWFDKLEDARRHYRQGVKELKAWQRQPSNINEDDYQPQRPRYYLAKLWKV